MSSWYDEPTTLMENLDATKSPDKSKELITAQQHEYK